MPRPAHLPTTGATNLAEVREQGLAARDHAKQPAKAAVQTVGSVSDAKKAPGSLSGSKRKRDEEEVVDEPSSEEEEADDEDDEEEEQEEEEETAPEPPKKVKKAKKPSVKEPLAKKAKKAKKVDKPAEKTKKVVSKKAKKVPEPEPEPAAPAKHPETARSKMKRMTGDPAYQWENPIRRANFRRLAVGMMRDAARAFPENWPVASEGDDPSLPPLPEVPQIRIQPKAMDILQRAVEGMMVDVFGGAAMVAAHAGRVGVTPDDMRLCNALVATHTGIAPETARDALQMSLAMARMRGDTEVGHLDTQGYMPAAGVFKLKGSTTLDPTTLRLTGHYKIDTVRRARLHELMGSGLSRAEAYAQMHSEQPAEAAARDRPEPDSESEASDPGSDSGDAVDNDEEGEEAEAEAEAEEEEADGEEEEEAE